MTFSFNLADITASLPRFVNLTLLGKGGFGAVYKCKDNERRMPVALKIIKLSGNRREKNDSEARGIREFKALAFAICPNLVSVFDRGRSNTVDSSGNETDIFWYTMELCDGNIKGILENLKLEARVCYSLQIVSALGYLFEKGVAHRDLKPENCFVKKKRKTVVLGDFGFAKGTKTRKWLDTDITTEGKIMGTAPYMAPECWEGKLRDDWRYADQYAAGVVVYELLTKGDFVFDIESTDARGFLIAHFYGGPKPLVVPERSNKHYKKTDKILGRMLEKKPEDRYKNMATCLRDLRSALMQDGLLSSDLNKSC